MKIALAKKFNKWHSRRRRLLKGAENWARSK